MSLILQTSQSFASASAAGADWREVGRKILEGLESVRTEGDQMNIGFLYMTGGLGEDAASLLALLKDVTRISAWYGATGPGICGNGVSYGDGPAAVAMIGALPAGSFHGFQLRDRDMRLPEALTAWLQAGHTPMAALTHGMLCHQAAQRLRVLRESDGLYTVGGFAGAERDAGPGPLHFSDGQGMRGEETLSGVVIDASAEIMTAASFGCAHAGPCGRITAAHGSVIETIDDLPAAEFLRNAIDQLDLHDDADNAQARIDQYVTRARQGHVHAAFPIHGADKTQLLVRNITSVDEDSGHIRVAHSFARGDRIQFVYRDRQTATADLTQTLTGLYRRAAETVGAVNLKPKAILYFGCAARMPLAPEDDEAALIAQVFSGVPMAGFYTAAEICNGYVYGYTGVIVLLL